MSSQRFLPHEMELFRTDNYYVLLNSVSSLWCDRKTGGIEVKPGWELANAGDPECLGVFYGLVGRIGLQQQQQQQQQLHQRSTSLPESRLVLIKSVAPVGDLTAVGSVHKIRGVALLHICGAEVSAAELGLASCRKHHRGCIGGSAASSGGAAQVAAATAVGVAATADRSSSTSFAKTWGSIKSATSSIKSTTQQAAALATSQVKGGSTTKKDSKEKDREKHERRILDEVQRIFTDTDSFYFSIANASGQPGDLTNTLQRNCELQQLQQSTADGTAENNNSCLNQQLPPVWKSVDERFFWNKHMLKDIIELNNPLADYWILPIIQGFVQIESCQVEIGPDPADISLYLPKYETLSVVLVSRRSRHRAGTRYKRRGVDEAGCCANYVETEQIVTHRHHHCSFTQVRGSVPVYWSQPGYKYRPPPRLDKGEAETRQAFGRHFETEMGVYGAPVCCVNLVEQTGKERVIWEAFTQHILAYNHPGLVYATFDFHEYCRGMHFENVSVLVRQLADVLHDCGFCWTDRQGLICRQKGVFRTNCIDCLDRTNVVQTALAKAMLQIQLTKLGLLPPEGILPQSLKRSFQLLWANNGDIISKQYAGTNALKGDYTRTGERKLSGMMKDGMNSANRYWRVHALDGYRQAALDACTGVCVCESPPRLDVLAADVSQLLESVPRRLPLALLTQVACDIRNTNSNSGIPSEIKVAIGLFAAASYYLSRFKDVYRQTTIDIMQGNRVSDDLSLADKQDNDEDNAATAEHVKLLLEDCKKMLISDSTMVLGAWGLIDADPQTGDPAETDMDTILILTRDSYYVADYDEDIDQITKYQRVMLFDVEMVELGQMEIAVPSQSIPMNLFNKARGAKNTDLQYCLRINYAVNGASGFCHTFRSTNLRFFNNVAVVINNDDEMIESLRAICETMEVALQIAGVAEAVVVNKERLEKKVSRNLIGDVSPNNSEPHSLPAKMTRNVSETQLHSLKNVGTKALSNVTQQFNKLNKLGHSFNTRRRHSKTSPETQKMDSLKLAASTNNSGQAVDLSRASSDEEEANSDKQMKETNKNSGGDKVREGHTVEESRSGVERRSSELFLPISGIIMSSTSVNALPSKSCHRQQHRLNDNITNECLNRVIDSDGGAGLKKYPLVHAKTDLSIDVSKMSMELGFGGGSSGGGSNAHTPEIVINRAKQHKLVDLEQQTARQQFGRTRQYSHSSGEVDASQGCGLTSSSAGAAAACSLDATSGGGGGSGSSCKRSTSEKDLILSGISSSQSETALKSMMRSTASSVLSSPSAVFGSSPFSKLARGVQSLGANLDPRKLSGSGASGSSGGKVQPAASSAALEARAAEAEKLQRLWKETKCKTRLIAV